MLRHQNTPAHSCEKYWLPLLQADCQYILQNQKIPAKDFPFLFSGKSTAFPEFFLRKKQELQDCLLWQKFPDTQLPVLLHNPADLHADDPHKWTP